MEKGDDASASPSPACRLQGWLQSHPCGRFYGRAVSMVGRLRGRLRLADTEPSRVSGLVRGRAPNRRRSPDCCRSVRWSGDFGAGLRLLIPVAHASPGLFGAVPRTGAGRPTRFRLAGRWRERFTPKPLLRRSDLPLSTYHLPRAGGTPDLRPRTHHPLPPSRRRANPRPRARPRPGRRPSGPWHPRFLLPSPSRAASPCHRRRGTQSASS
jgi:hypothetical protein